MLKQEEMILMIRDKGIKDERIDSILMYGSFTQSSGDRFSDIEFYIFVDDIYYEEFDTEKWISSAYPIYTHFFNEYGSEVVIFTNLIRGEFHFLPRSEMTIIESFASVGYFPDINSMCLCDKNGSLRKSLRALQDCKVERQTAENVEFVFNNLLNAILFGINVFKRGEWARSLECLYYSQKYYLQLIRLLENKTEHWVNPFKSLEKEISVSAYEAYSKCTASLEPSSILSSYKNLLKESKNNIHILKSKYNITNFNELIDKIEKHVESQI
ncbi:lincosamide nucleotidyltransferase Lnu(B) [Desulfotomaculum sp. 1211_IL3151]|uniref:lincosamide nucleotidyltransferase Lnu(B) n=1 Tax=Desulfotomaculum sp. 1211_IL3151 TaxID=3084055 RepID=UPI002FD89DE1